MKKLEISRTLEIEKFFLHSVESCVILKVAYSFAQDIVIIQADEQFLAAGRHSSSPCTGLVPEIVKFFIIQWGRKAHLSNSGDFCGGDRPNVWCIE
jgi:hypothetical protein